MSKVVECNWGDDDELNLPEIPHWIKPELKLIRATILQAYLDLKDENYKTSALRWFLSEDSANRLYSFKWCCDNLDIDRDNAVQALREIYE